MAEAATPAAPAAAPAAPATAPAPVAATPAAAAPAATPAAAPAAAGKPDSIIGDAKGAPPAIDAVKAFLTEKGAKAEELAALDETALRTKYDEAKAAEAKAPTEVKVEDIVVKLPDGVVVDEKLLGEFKGIIANAKLSPSERAQALLDQHVAALKGAGEAAAKASWDAFYKTQADWQKEVKADTELGGANFDKTRATIAAALSQFGGAEEKQIRDAMDMTGAGNNPALVRVFYRMAAALTEGGVVVGAAPGASKSAAEMLYPTATKS